MGAGDPPAHVGDVRGYAFGEGCGEIRDGAGVGERRVLAAAELDAGRQRPRPADLDLERALVTIRHLFQRVEVGGQHALGAAQVAPWPGGEPPPAGGELGRHIDQKGGGAPGQVRAGAPGWQLGEVRQVRQLTEDQPQRLGRVGAGQRANSGSARGRPWERIVGDLGHAAELKTCGSCWHRDRAAPARYRTRRWIGPGLKRSLRRISPTMMRRRRPVGSVSASLLVSVYVADRAPCSRDGAPAADLRRWLAGSPGWARRRGLPALPGDLANRGGSG